MPAAVAIPLAMAGGSAIAGIAGAKIQSGAAGRAADAQTQAANKAAEIQAQSAREALQFQREAAAQDAQRFDVTQRGNYEQNAARERRLGSIGQLVGLAPREIPAYQSIQPGQSPQGMNTGGADPKIASAIQAYQAAHPVSEGIAPLAAALKSQGFNVDRYMYGSTPSDNELDIAGQKYKVLGGEKTPGAYWYQPGMDDSAPGASVMAPKTTNPNTIGGLVGSPYAATSPLTPALPVVAPYSIRSLVGR